ncbi:MAG: DegQ family serine endoprotease [Betaproteobacteria bacterium]|nr:DegQ family serine endoprotease [Betaproteobacteria bacterium]
MKAKSVVHSLIAAAVIGAFGAGVYSAGHSWISHASAASAPALAAAAPAANVLLPDFTAIVDRNGPAVVNISVTQNVKTGASATPFSGIEPGDPFFEFFRQFRELVPRGDVPVRNLGSGFIVSPDGVILTNAHVVAEASEVTVKLTDKREFKAKVIGSDRQSDVAVLRIAAKGLPAVKLGSSTGVKVGEWVLAIGSPYGFDNSVTSGIVSAKARSLPDGTYVPFIQTDVAVNPGNSGGPLFNMKGEVVGINSQIYSRTGGYQGLSFAIPIELAVKVKDQLQQYGKVSRGRLGVAIQEVSQPLADSFGLKSPRGALVTSVEDNGPAAKAGVASGDVILKFNGKEISSSSELPPLVADAKPGSRAELEVWRKGSTKNITVTLGEFKDRSVASSDSPDQRQGRLGLALRPLTPQERRQFGSSGLLVEDVSGPAARAGIRPGDVVLSLNGTQVQSVEQLRALLAKAGKKVALLVQRDNTKIFIPVDIRRTTGRQARCGLGVGFANPTPKPQRACRPVVRRSED